MPPTLPEAFRPAEHPAVNAKHKQEMAAVLTMSKTAY